MVERTERSDAGTSIVQEVSPPQHTVGREREQRSGIEDSFRIADNSETMRPLLRKLAAARIRKRHQRK